MWFFSSSGTARDRENTSPWFGWGKIGFFVATAVVFCWAIDWILEYCESSQEIDFLVALTAIVITPALLLLSWVGLRQARKSLVGLCHQLRWYHFIWFLMYISDFVWRLRNAETLEGNPLDPDTWARIGPELFIGFVLLFGLARKKIDWPKSMFQGLLNSIIVFCVIAAASTLWSVYKPFSLYKSMEFLLDAAILGMILLYMDNVETFKTFWDFNWLVTGATLFWVWCGLLVFPGEALQPVSDSGDQIPRLQGVVPVVGYNAVGVAGAILAIIALARLFPYARAKAKNWEWYLGLLLFGCASMFMAQTRSAIGGFGLAAILVLILAGRFYLLLGTASVTSALLLFTPLGSLAYDFLTRSQSAEEMESLSGRTEWWGYAYDVWKQHPYTGVGMYAAGKFAVLAKLGDRGDTLHSDWLEIFVGTSVWGLFPVIFLVLGCWWLLAHYVSDKEFSIEERQLAMEAIGVLLILTVRSFFNVELVWHSPSNFFPVVAYAEYLRRRRRTMQLDRESRLAKSSFGAQNIGSIRSQWSCG